MKTKSLQLNYSQNGGPHVTVQEDTGKARAMFASSSHCFIELSDESGMSMAIGPSGKVNKQYMPQNEIYAGIIKPVGFPFGLIPSSLAIPIPSYRLQLPFAGMTGDLVNLAIGLTSFVV